MIIYYLYLCYWQVNSVCSDQIFYDTAGCLVGIQNDVTKVFITHLSDQKATFTFKLYIPQPS